MKLLYLMLLLVMVSCTHKTAKENKTTGAELESMSIDTVLKDTFMSTPVEIKGQVGVSDIESLQIWITNRGKEAIAVDDSYRISALEPGREPRLLLDRKLDAPVLVPAGEERALIINLELDKIRYSRNAEYMFSTSYKVAYAEGGAVSELFYLFRTPEMWKEGKSITLMPDTMIDH